MQIIVVTPKLLRYFDNQITRDGARSENLSGQVVMRRAATARRRLLFCQNLPCPPTSAIPEKYIRKYKLKVLCTWVLHCKKISIHESWILDPLHTKAQRIRSKANELCFRYFHPIASYGVASHQKLSLIHSFALIFFFSIHSNFKI